MSDPYVWRQVDRTTTYTRHLYGKEAQLAVLADAVDGLSACIAAMTITSPGGVESLIPKLQAAWIALRFLSPLQAIKLSHLQGNEYEATYTSPANSDDTELNSWIDQTLVRRTPCFTSTDLVTDIINDKDAVHAKKPALGNYVTSLYYAKSAADKNKIHLCMYATHAVLDARGALQAFDHMMGTMASAAEDMLSWGSETSRLMLPMSHAAGMRRQDAAISRPFEEVKQAIAAKRAESQPTAQLPAFKTAPEPAGITTRLSGIQLPASLVESLLSTSKQHGARFSYVLTAIIALVAYKNCANPGEAKTVSFPTCVADQRYRLRDPSQPVIANFMINVGSAYIPVTLLKQAEHELTTEKKFGEGFWKAVAEIDSAWGSTEQADVVLGMEQDFAAVFGEIARSGPEQMFPPAFFHSPVGVIETLLEPEYGELAVSDPVTIAYTSSAPMLTLHSWTFGGVLSIVVNYSESFYPEDLIQKMLGEIQELLEFV